MGTFTTAINGTQDHLDPVSCSVCYLEVGQDLTSIFQEASAIRFAIPNEVSTRTDDNKAVLQAHM